MDGRLLVRFFTTYAIRVGLVIAVPQVVAWLFPVFWVEDHMNLKMAFAIVYLIASWVLLSRGDVITHYPEDQGFGYNFGKPLLLRGLLSTFCWVVAVVGGCSPFIGLYLAKPNW